MQSAYGGDLELFREGVQAFFRRDVEPRLRDLEKGADERFWKDAASAGLLGVVVPERYGGPGADPLAMVIISEELGRSPAGAVLGSSLNSDMSTMFLLLYGTEAQKQEWLPRIVRGDVIQATALTEAGSGSDASKRHIATMSFRGGDTAELFFDNVRVSARSLLGPEGNGLKMFQPVITLDRLQICGRSQGAAEGAFALTLDYVRRRKIFGQRLVDFQNTQFKLAEMETEIAVGRAFLNDLVRKYRAGEMTARDASMLKIWLPEMENRVIDACLQFWGGTGFSDESTISRMYTAARAQRIYAGATELQKAMMGRSYTKN